jgi:CPA2 family monovalent cation:H+ antiporter-2
MGDAHVILNALLPIIMLLAMGVAAAIGSREIGLSPIVGYILLGMLLRATGFDLGRSADSIEILAELGVLFLLFDIGLHFSFAQLRTQAKDIFGFGPVQVLFASALLALPGLLLGLAGPTAILIGATLALSSTAVVARVIADRHQQSCPVGVTATAILIFQDVAAIFILIVATSLGGGTALLPTIGLAVMKASCAFVVAIVLSSFVVRPVFDFAARGRNEEIFTALALLVALAAGWATGSVGLSLTLGAFLGGAMLSDTPYRAIIQSEVKPFRGLLLGFFFVAVGLSLDIHALARLWPAVLLVAVLLLAVKVVANAAASLIFRWSVPGSVQISFLLAQGSEFAFVILSLPQVRAMVGSDRSAVLVTAVALTLAVTPNLAELGRSIAGRLRLRQGAGFEGELVPGELVGPVLILGMGPTGRAIADALTAFNIGYAAMDGDQKRLREAVADGYRVSFGELADPRIWEPVAMEGRRVSVLTEPSLEVSTRLTPLARRLFPNLKRIAVVHDIATAAQFASVGLTPVVEDSEPVGSASATAVLAMLDVDPDAIASWARSHELRETELQVA